jgi:DNA-binding GntR family transcriptional regulator
VQTGSSDVLHDQISEFIRSKIATGGWPPNYKLRAEVDLADEFGVARGTVRRAIRTLVEDGLLVQKHGKGNVCHRRRRGAGSDQPITFHA